MVSFRRSRVRTKFYGSIIDSGSERVLINIYNLTIILNPLYLKKSLFMCLCSYFNVSVVVNFLSHVIFCFPFVSLGMVQLYMYKYMRMKLKQRKIKIT